MNLNELRQVRRLMGHDVEKSEREFLLFLGKLKSGLEDVAGAKEMVKKLYEKN